VSAGGQLPRQSAEELLENAPCGFLSTALDGTILKVNRTFEAWTGLDRSELVGRRRFQDLLAGGGRIYYETHFAPLLQMQGEVREIAFDLLRADGTRLPALVNSAVIEGPAGRPEVVETMVFDASDRRRYEEELLRSRRREQEIAQQLQESLLAGELPRGEGFEIGAAYQPGVGGTEVGGDWYDAFWLDETKVGLYVGDVVGRGIGAAATMGQLRSATRAFASTGRGPGRILDALDVFVARHRVGQMATLACAEVDTRTGELAFACAGHLPPLLSLGDAGAPRLDWRGRSAPLGIRPGPSGRPEAACRLTPESLFLLYTDGLVERRGRSIDEGLERLLAEVGSRTPEAPGALANETMRQLEDREHGDDVCLLAFSIGPSRLSKAQTATPKHIEEDTDG
jgi:sigma-B regulation protein RsbU (phosphoserine phosphatase)